MSEQQAPSQRSVLNWLAYYKPIVVEIETDMGERHRLIIDQKNARRWHGCYANLVSLHAVVARALDAKDNVLDTKMIAPRPPSTTEDAAKATVDQPATHQGVDIAAIVNTVADAAIRIAETTMKAAAEAHKASFQELTALVRANNERSQALEKTVYAQLKEREDRIADEEERIEDERVHAEEERARVEAERLAEREENREVFSIIKPLVEAAAPELIQKGMAMLGGGKTSANGAPKAPAAKPLPEPAPKAPPPTTEK